MVRSRFVSNLLVVCFSFLCLPSLGEVISESSVTEEVCNDSGAYNEGELLQLMSVLQSCSEEFQELCARLGLKADSEELVLREPLVDSFGDKVIEEEQDGFLGFLVAQLENIAQDLNDSEQLIRTLIERQKTAEQIAYMQRELDIRERELEFKKELLAWVKEKTDRELQQQKERLIRDLFLKNNIGERGN